MQPGSSERLYYVDWLRVFAVFLLIPFHTAMIFVFWNWHIKNPTLSWELTVFNSFLGIWHMPLFFFLSGVGTYFALSFRSSREYVKERLLRLFIPLVFGMLAVVPPQIYLERLHRLQYQGGYIDFYPSIFLTGSYPEGNLSWHHLWFLAYLTVFSLLALPLFNYLKNERSIPFINKVTSFFSKGQRIFLLALPLVFYQVALRVKWPGGNQNLYDDWANFFFYLTLFILGYFLCTDEKLQQAPVKNRKAALSLGTALALFLLALDLLGKHPTWGYNPFNLAMLGLNGFITWCWILAILGFGRVYLNRTNSFLKYTAEASFPFYILHQTIIILLAYYIVQYNWPIALKFVVINILSFSITLACYDLLVKRIKVLRFLFGMKNLKRAGKCPNQCPIPNSQFRTHE
ncbi:MAG: acyltransferase family protein [Bacillota bacterium]